MTVTELALMRLAPNVSIQDPSLKRDLVTAKNAMESFTGNTFHFYSKLDDPSSIYIIGSWTSIKQHWDHWIPSQGNQNLLSLLKDQLSVEWMFHIDLEQTRIPLGAPVLVVERYFVPTSKKAELPVDAVYPQHTQCEPVGGWRIEKEEEGNEEFVLFSGFGSTKEHTRATTLSIGEMHEPSVGYWKRLQL